MKQLSYVIPIIKYILMNQLYNSRGSIWGGKGWKFGGGTLTSREWRQNPSRAFDINWMPNHPWPLILGTSMWQIWWRKRQVQFGFRIEAEWCLSYLMACMWCFTSLNALALSPPWIISLIWMQLILVDFLRKSNRQLKITTMAKCFLYLLNSQR